MKRRQTEPVRIHYYHYIGVGVIHANFDNSSGDQYLYISGDESFHGLKLFFFLHGTIEDRA